MRHLLPRRLAACETPRKLACTALVAVVIATALSIAAPARPLYAAQAEPATAAPHAESEATHEEHEEGGHDGPLQMIARFVNFAILAGSLVYLLRSPIGQYLRDRSGQIRADLVNAAEMKQTAAAQIAEIDAKMQALPAELEALRAQGVREIAAEEARIATTATSERERLLDQARREIDLQVKVAERELVAHAADLAVALATDRIKAHITDDDQKRLVERYVRQLTS